MFICRVNGYITCVRRLVVRAIYNLWCDKLFESYNKHPCIVHALAYVQYMGYNIV